MSINIPSVQRAIVALPSGRDQLVKIVNDYPVPEVKPNQVLIRLTSSGVCHSDLSTLQGIWGGAIVAKVVGHEGSGYIVQHGSQVDATQYPLGTRVGVPLVSNPCRSCYACGLPDGEVYCPNSPFHGVVIDGTWKQYIAVNVSYVIPIPDEIKNSQTVGPLLCGGVTAYKALLTANKKSGQWVVITGAGGGLGTLAVQYAVALGLRVIAIDTGTVKKTLITERLGAEQFIDYMETEDVVGAVKRITGRGADAAIMLAPSEASYNQAIHYLGLQGMLVCVGLPKRGTVLQVEPATLIHTGIRVVGSLVGTRTDIIEALDFVARGKVTPAMEVRPMDDIREILEDMVAGKISGRVVINLE
ncbi:hypothetical protein BABINDRAFT_10100 [Babjeviella inositovora NRRL Y-12698]|uniref:alcohol dehydrogenase n=1 Tax=Babjeviella inositovora NRRL Y-12698 TaxID=984486 RepID=A0A1E3QIM6_9ASCO|nr:uncharacterized protein BABINDRAFT_10100 [Babjeviella inositovora NRRL Y-12698]ODQ77458.1 hypothetical protein BABINDRAFT_10100 [Babjeviella inositovora NRRL Y-12698]